MKTLKNQRFHLKHCYFKPVFTIKLLILSNFFKRASFSPIFRLDFGENQLFSPFSPTLPTNCKRSSQAVGHLQGQPSPNLPVIRKATLSQAIAHYTIRQPGSDRAISKWRSDAALSLILHQWPTVFHLGPFSSTAQAAAKAANRYCCQTGNATTFIS